LPEKSVNANDVIATWIKNFNPPAAGGRDWCPCGDHDLVHRCSSGNAAEPLKPAKFGFVDPCLNKEDNVDPDVGSVRWAMDGVATMKLSV
jgi:hypothetical protein